MISRVHFRARYRTVWLTVHASCMVTLLKPSTTYNLVSNVNLVGNTYQGRHDMFCYQCEETARGTGCTVRGVCSKDEELCGVMDVLLYLCRGIAVRDLADREAGGAGSGEARRYLADALF